MRWSFVGNVFGKNRAALVPVLGGRRSRRLSRVASTTRSTTTDADVVVVGAAAAAGAGAGLGNVRDKMLSVASLASYDDTDHGMFRHVKDPWTVSVIGAPMTHGQPYVGADATPSLLREKGLLSNLTKLGWRVEDLHDLDFSSDLLANDDHDERRRAHDHRRFNAKHSRVVGRGCERLAAMVEKAARAGRFPLVLGGDHSVATGSLAGVLRARPNTGVLWIDAHADLNTPAVSESGNLHGMPLGLLLEEEDDDDRHDRHDLPGFEWLRDGPRLPADSLVYVGLRDVDLAERAVIRNRGIAAFSMHDVDRHGIGNVMEAALRHLLRHGDRPLHLSYDIDAVDPSLAPATGTAVRGGLTFREAHYVAEAAAASGALASGEIVEMNPSLASSDDDADGTTDLGMQLLTSLMGKSII